MTYILLLLLVTSVMHTSEHSDYSWPKLDSDDVKLWTRLDAAKPDEGKMILALDSNNKIWLGHYAKGNFIPATGEECVWPFADIEVTNWQYVKDIK